MRKKNELVTIFTRELTNGLLSVCFNYRVNGVRHRENFKGVTLFARPKSIAEKYHNDKVNQLITARKAELTQKILSGTIETHIQATRDKTRLVEYLVHCTKVKTLRLNSTKNYQTLSAYVSEFDNIHLTDVNADYILAFQSFLLRKGLKNSSVRSHLRVFKSALSLAVIEDKIIINPFTKIAPSMLVNDTPATREYLTADEVARLANSHYANNYVIRAFLFSCYTGLRFGDVSTLTDKNFSLIDGVLRCKGTAQKTNKPFDFAVSDNTKRFLPSFPFYGYAFGACSNHNANRTLNKAITALGIEKHITFHCSRHTCATRLLNDVGASTEIVKAILGHSDLRTTQIYAKLLDERKDKALELL